ncbi:MAG: hypothetical protein QOE93_1609 [Actinomycetota bacterium]|nr:hypothetical protein [Actinomycetota bacterium]
MPGDIIVCSLEAWDDVWRRNQFLVRELLELRPSARILFVAPPRDALHDLTRRSMPVRPSLRAIEAGRLWQLTPGKWLPRVLGPFADRSLYRQVLAAVAEIGLSDPVLWVNDSVYAGLAEASPFPTVYDVTDDWLLLPFPPREMARRRAREDTLLRRAEEVVVCSQSLAASRGASRPVHLIPNAVDGAAFRRPAPRPADLPAGATAVYVGTLHEDRLDLDLVTGLAAAAPQAAVVLVGPVELTSPARRRLDAVANVHVLGARPYPQVPGYLQHATVVMIPHRITPFTSSLDPIKAYECEAVGTPTIATPLPGFVPDRNCIRSVEPDLWVEAVRLALADPPPRAMAGDLPTWRDRAESFDTVLGLAAENRRVGETAERG